MAENILIEKKRNGYLLRIDFVGHRPEYAGSMAANGGEYVFESLGRVYNFLKKEMKIEPDQD